MIYVVKSGDSLSKIGSKFNVNWHTIASTNNIKPPYIIKSGQRLTIPTGGSSSSGGSSSGGTSTSTSSGNPYNVFSPISMIINGVILYGIYQTLKKVL